MLFHRCRISIIHSINLSFVVTNEKPTYISYIRQLLGNTNFSFII